MRRASITFGDITLSRKRLRKLSVNGIVFGEGGVEPIMSWAEVEVEGICSSCFPVNRRVIIGS